MAETVTTAFSVAPASAEKTDLISKFEDVLSSLDDAAAAGAFSEITAAQLKSQVIDVAETVAANMREHS